MSTGGTIVSTSSDDAGKTPTELGSGADLLEAVRESFENDRSPGERFENRKEP